MAAQFYSRYIPPSNTSLPASSGNKKVGKSKSKKRNHQKVVGDEISERAESSSDGVPKKKRTKLGKKSIHLDKSKLHGHEVERAGPVPSRAVVPAIPGSDEKFPEGPLENHKGASTKKERKRKKSHSKDVDSPMEASKPIINGHDDGPNVAEDKHKSIRSKFDKSRKAVASLRNENLTSEKAAQVSTDDQEEPAEVHGLDPLPQPPPVPDSTTFPRLSALPDWLANTTQASTQTTLPLKDLNLSSKVMENLVANGYNEAFAVQAAALPMLLEGISQYKGDLCISAATGSGKTLTYVLPMIEDLKEKPVTKLRGLVVVPTRELVYQALETFQTCATGIDFQVGTAVGNKSLSEERDSLIERDRLYDPESIDRPQEWNETTLQNISDDSDEEDLLDIPMDFTTTYSSKVDVLICTPGRLVDHLRTSKGFTLEDVRWLVIDEADRLLDQSFQGWIDAVMPPLHAQPKPDRWIESIQNSFLFPTTRQVRKIILSATMTKDVGKLAALKLYKPKLLVLERPGLPEISNSTAEAIGAEPQIHEGDVELPLTLTELAVGVKEAGDKPLYLIKLLDRLKSKTNQLLKRRTEDSISDERSSSLSDSSDSDLVDGERSLSKLNSHLANSSTTHGTLIFTNSNESALRLTRLLILLRPFMAGEIKSLTKSTATSLGRKLLSAFHKRKISILVASDRASRGLDLQDLAHVINYDMPKNLTSYVHRVGRTARAGKNGTATTLVAHHEGRWFWNEIARSGQVKRGKKVARENIVESISEEDREAYEEALKQLGKEARET